MPTFTKPTINGPIKTDKFVDNTGLTPIRAALLWQAPYPGVGSGIKTRIYVGTDDGEYGLVVTVNARYTTGDLWAGTPFVPDDLTQVPMVFFIGRSAAASLDPGVFCARYPAGSNFNLNASGKKSVLVASALTGVFASADEQLSFTGSGFTGAKPLGFGPQKVYVAAVGYVPAGGGLQYYGTGVNWPVSYPPGSGGPSSITVGGLTGGPSVGSANIQLVPFGTGAAGNVFLNYITETGFLLGYKAVTASAYYEWADEVTAFL